jgi:membrane-associated phospholipid phosphatase
MKRLPLLFLFCISLFATAQNADSILQRKITFKKIAAPLALFSLGAIAWNESAFIDRNKIETFRQSHVNFFDKHIDDYVQYAPVAVYYGLEVFGKHGKNSITEATFLLLKSELLTSAIVQVLKYTTVVERPDHSTFNSFPSGHTSQAFVAATFLHKEFGVKSILYSVAGYIVATGIGALRVLGNRHWLADVFVGAGIGILSTEFVYATHQYRWSKHKKLKITGLPSYNNGAYGLYLCLTVK